MRFSNLTINNYLKIYVILSVCIFSASISHGAIRNIYIDSGGSGDGTISDPYGSFGEINWSLINEWVEDGDNVYINLKRGEVWSGETFEIRASGKASNPIIIQPYGTGKLPKIDKLTNEYSNTTYCIKTNNYDYIVIDGLELYKAKYGIFINEGSTNITVINCVIHDQAKSGIYMDGASYNTIGGSEENGNELYGIDDSGSNNSGCSNITFARMAHHNIVSFNISRDAVDGLMSDPGRDNLIENNIFFGHYEDGFDLKDSKDTIVRFNYCYNNNAFGGQVQNDSSYIDVYGNLFKTNKYGLSIKDSDSGGDGTHHINAWSNLFASNKRNGIYSGFEDDSDKMWDVQVMNNVFYGNGTGSSPEKAYYSGLYISFGDNYVVKNNIFYKNRPDASDYRQAYINSDIVSEVTFANNVYYFSQSREPKVHWGDLGDKLIPDLPDKLKNGNVCNAFFYDAENDKFWSTSESDCLDKGERLDEKFEIALVPGYQPPDKSRIGIQGSEKWSIGAYRLPLQPPLLSIKK